MLVMPASTSGVSPLSHRIELQCADRDRRRSRSGCSSNPYAQFNTAAFSGPQYGSLGMKSGRNARGDAPPPGTAPVGPVYPAGLTGNANHSPAYWIKVSANADGSFTV